MSRWLRSVNNLLETLDTGVENVVEHRTGKYNEDDEGNVDADDVGGQSSVDDILAKRGLLLSSQLEDGDDEEEEQGRDNENFESDNDFGHVDDLGQGQDYEKYDNSYDLVHVKGRNDRKKDIEQNLDVHEPLLLVEPKLNTDSSSKTQDQQSQVRVHVVMEDQPELKEQLQQDQDGQEEEILEKHDNDDNSIEKNIPEKVKGMESNTVIAPNNLDLQSSSSSSSSPGAKVPDNKLDMDQIRILQEEVECQKKLAREALDEKKEAVKESRKLRRNIVKLNAELDSAERELDAQRTELERAATRIEKDLQRFKEEKGRMEMSHKEDLKAIAEEHRASVTGMTNAHSKQIADMEERIRRAEEARAKEGGDMSAELAESAERERNAMKQIRALEEEKSTLAAQVSSLTTQIAGLESRVEMSQQAADSASERERDADNRLDATLSLHARQLSLRQAREAELERTVSDLTAALVESRARETSLLKNRDVMDRSDEGKINAVDELKDKLLGAKDEVEMLHNQLMVEKHKADMLQQELEDLSREQAQEASMAAAQQIEYDQRIAELNATISKLQSQKSGKNFNGLSTGNAHSVSDSVVHKLQSQVASLSEDLFRYKEKLQYSSTEIQTLRNRLNSALSRADIAEKAAAAQSYDVESRRFRSKEILHRKKMTITSISSAFKLDAGRGEKRETVGKIIDTIDTVVVDMGSYFRSDPFARAVFIFYLMILHVWGFCLLIFHAHGTLEPAPDVGPEQLLKHSYRHYEQAGVP
eukprot:CAMPEP_0176484910 /NCGR_PEP_ID=MMETSP0200_2-20121128/4745_1 /TAXON_ID=947934 /ORGANISM="Chaetoceros sp., Strain GSL56" /LENGTH=759 /DNA_ID=CAMNT_0017881493 /DNA_START=27 /DNA_END=2306 /DNA_ORIENTATION=-